MTSGTLPSTPMIDAGAGDTVRVTSLLLKISPYHSVVNLSGLRFGNCAPMPNGMPLERSYSSVSPRCRYPMLPETSAVLATSLLTMKSN